MAGPNTKILLVDDFGSMRRVIKMLLAELEYHDVVEATDGLVASRILSTQMRPHERIDLIITDWDMPHMSGDQLIAMVRRSPPIAHIPIILITGDNQKKTQGIQIGANACISKPFTLETLRCTIDAVLRTET